MILKLRLPQIRSKHSNEEDELHSKPRLFGSPFHSSPSANRLYFFKEEGSKQTVIYYWKRLNKFSSEFLKLKMSSFRFVRLVCTFYALRVIKRPKTQTRRRKAKTRTYFRGANNLLSIKNWFCQTNLILKLHFRLCLKFIWKKHCDVVIDKSSTLHSGTNVS